MLETLMLGKRGGLRTLVDIDFSNAVLGSTEIIDKGTLGAKYTRARIGGTAGDGVVDVPGKGRAYYFDGLTKFTADVIPVIYNKVFKMTAEIMASPAKSGTIVGSGAYPDAVNRRSGFALHAGQYPTAYIQYFMVDAPGNYQRVLLDGAIPANAIDKIVVNRYLNGSMSVESVTRGVRNNYPAVGWTNPESYFMIGSTHSNDTFQGHLFSLKIEVQF